MTTPQATAPGLTYDTGALIAAERADRLLWSLHRAAVGRGLVPTVPSAVLAQAWRGGPQVPLSRLLRGCAVDALDEDAGREAGALCGAAGTSDVVDAAVVIGARARGDSVITSDPHDIEHLAQAAGATVTVFAV